jgi:hypothetical protein
VVPVGLGARRVLARSGGRRGAGAVSLASERVGAWVVGWEDRSLWLGRPQPPEVGGESVPGCIDWFGAGSVIVKFYISP